MLKTNNLRLENVRLQFSFEKAFINDFSNNFITTLLGILPHEIGIKGDLFNLGLEPIFGPKKRCQKITCVRNNIKSFKFSY